MPVLMLGPRGYTDLGLGSLRVSLGHGIEREQGPPQSVLGLRVRFKTARAPVPVQIRQAAKGQQRMPALMQAAACAWA